MESRRGKRYFTEQDLADELGVSVERLSVWRRRYGWPHLLIGREVRFTFEQVREIEERHTVRRGTTIGARHPGALSGQTARSAAHTSSRQRS